MITCRPYQLAAVGGISLAWRNALKRVVFVLPTGGGKTTVAAEMVRRAVQNGRRVLFLAHRRRLIQQIAERCGLFGVRYGIIMADLPAAEWVKRDPNAPLQIASRDTLLSRVMRHGWDGLPVCDLLIIDECFPAGTLVDGRPIETIRAGDTVTAFDPATKSLVRRTVTRVFHNPAPAEMIAVTAGGVTVHATPNHPFLTSRGWVNACDISCLDSVFVVRNVGDAHDQEPDRELPCASAGVLLAGSRAGVRQGDHEAPRDATASTCGEARASQEGEPDALIGNSGEAVRFPEGDGAQAGKARRQRTGAVAGGTGSLASDRTEALCGADRRAGARVPDALQAGSRGPVGDAGGGDRRGEPQRSEGTGRGPAEGGVLTLARVDRVEVHQLAGADGHNSLCPGGVVYNLEVEGEHTYLANGFAVHNCHNVESESYRKLAEACNVTFWIGLTATPCRPDGSGLGAHIWDTIVEGATVQALIAEGFLVPVKVYAPPGVGEKRRRGDKTPIAGDPVDHWQRYAAGLPTVVFTRTVAESVAVRDRYRAAGVPAEHIDAETPYEERERYIADVESGKTLVLTNAQVLTEGVDVPKLACCQLLCKCGSIIRLLQSVGRVMRPYPGKTHAILLDHAGAVFQHGMPGEPIEWSLSESDLDKRLKKEREDGTRAEPVLCGRCGLIFGGAPVCPECGAPVPRRKAKGEEPGLAHERLVQVSGEPGPQRDMMQREWTKTLYVARAKGWTLGRASAVFKKKFGEWPDKLGMTPRFPFGTAQVLVQHLLEQAKAGGAA